MASAEMAEYLQRVGEQPSELLVEEWNLLPLVYKNGIGSRRAAWRVVITSVEQKEKFKGKKQLVSHAREYVAKVEGELQKIRDGILALMDKKLIPSPSTDESKSFYYKMKGDYYRYLAEFATGDAKSKACEDAGFAYAEASKIAEKDLVVTHPARLAMALNSSVFLHEVLQNPDEACGTKAAQDQLAMDTKFLQSLKTRCSETNEEFRRVADRQAELKAVIDAIGILNSDTSFDTFDKTDSTDFLQMSPLAGEQALRQRALSVLRDAMNKMVDDPVVQVVHVPQLQIVDVPVPQVVEDLVEVSKVFPQNRIQQRFVEQTVETLALSLAVKITEVPVIQTQRKTQQIVNTDVQHVVNTVEVEKAIIQVKINQGTMHIETPELQFLDKVDDMPVVVPRQVSMVPKSQKTIEIPPLQKTVETPETQMIQSTHTSESLGNAPVHQVAQGEIVEAVEIEVPLPAESASLMSVTEPVLEVPPVVVEYMQPVPVAEYVEPAPAHAATCAHAASIVEYMTPAVVDVPVVWQRQAPVIDRIMDVPVVWQRQAPVTDRIMDVPVVLQRQGPAIQAVQQIVEVPQVQYI